MLLNKRSQDLHAHVAYHIASQVEYLELMTDNIVWADKKFSHSNYSLRVYLAACKLQHFKLS